jgi:hypothetical protein
MLDALTLVLAKLAALPVALKAAVGIAAATAAIGTAGVLPPAAHDTPDGPDSGAVQTVDQDDTDADEAEGATDDANDDADDAAEATDEGAGRPTDAPVLPDAAAFGQSVAQDARDGGVDGQEVAELAKANGDANRPADVGPSAAPVVPTVPPQAETGLATATAASGHEVPVGPAGRP